VLLAPGDKSVQQLAERIRASDAGAVAISCCFLLRILSMSKRLPRLSRRSAFPSPSHIGFCRNSGNMSGHRRWSPTRIFPASSETT